MSSPVNVDGPATRPIQSSLGSIESSIYDISNSIERLHALNQHVGGCNTAAPEELSNEQGHNLLDQADRVACRLDAKVSQLMRAISMLEKLLVIEPQLTTTPVTPTPSVDEELQAFREWKQHELLTAASAAKALRRPSTRRATKTKARRAKR